MLKSGHSQKLLDKREMELVYNKNGRPLNLKNAILNSLRDIRDSYGIERLNETLLVDFPKRKKPLWLFRSELFLATRLPKEA